MPDNSNEGNVASLWESEETETFLRMNGKRVVLVQTIEN
jgi:hypothetical protein